MKFIILKKNLKDGLKVIEKAVEDSSNLLVLKNFLIESFDNKIKLSATNLELAIINFISGKIIENGGLSIPLNIFNSIINNIQSERINLELTQNNKLLIKTDNYSAEIQGLKKEEFPIIPKIKNNSNYIEISNLILKDALASVINSINLNNSRPELNGVLFDYQNTILKLAATDGFRLSEKTINNTQFESNFNAIFKIIIPVKTVQETIKELQINENGSVKIYFDSNQILFKTENTEIISRLINGEFPEYNQIVPKNFEVELNLNKEELTNAVKLTGLFSDNLNEIKLIIKENNKNVELFSSNQNLGENKYLIPAKIKGATSPIEIIFNWRFLLDGAKILKSENIFIGLNNQSKPALIKSLDDASWFYVLMPIKS